jgi:hypothetical protein
VAVAARSPHRWNDTGGARPTSNSTRETGASMTRFPTEVSLDGRHPLRIVTEQPSFPHPVCWDIDYVFASPARRSPAYDDLLTQTFGGTTEWGDEFLFDRQQRHLRSLALRVPERAGDGASAEAWVSAPRTAGGILASDREPIAVDSVTTRVLTTDGETLVCMAADRVHHPWSLLLTQDLALLFDDQRYAGWMLLNPILHLRPTISERQEMLGAFSPVARAVRELEDILVEDAIDALFAGDSEMIRRLKELRSRIDALAPSSQRKALLAKIDDLIGRL